MVPIGPKNMVTKNGAPKHGQVNLPRQVSPKPSEPGPCNPK